MIKKGSWITAEHIPSGQIVEYLVIENKCKFSNKFGILSIDTFNVLAYSANDVKRIIEYIINVLKCKILEIDEKAVVNPLVEELKEQINGWRKQQENLENMIEEAHKRIDEIEEMEGSEHARVCDISHIYHR